MTRYEILPDAQRVLLPMLSPLKDLGFVLYGGTAIALHLGHRVSIDFDFFNDRAADRGRLVEALPLLGTSQTLQDERDTWTVLVAAAEQPSVKLSFFTSLGFGRVGAPVLADEGDLLLASLDDLFGHKLKVLLQRVQAKDYIDIAAMLDSGKIFEDGLGAAVALFPNVPPCEVARALSYFKGGDLASLALRTRETLVAHVGRLGAPSLVRRLSSSLSV